MNPIEVVSVVVLAVVATTFITYKVAYNEGFKEGEAAAFLATKAISVASRESPLPLTGKDLISVSVCKHGYPEIWCRSCTST